MPKNPMDRFKLLERESWPMPEMWLAGNGSPEVSHNW
jgi:hypothetical protein